MIATAVVLILIFVIFHYLNSLHNDIQAIAEQTKETMGFIDESQVLVISILKKQRKLLSSKTPLKEILTSMVEDCENFTSRLQEVETYHQKPEAKEVLTQMISYVDSLKLILNKSILFFRSNDGKETIGDLTDKILESFAKFQKVQYRSNINQDKRMKKIVNDTKQRMMIVLLIGLFFTILLSILLPGRITLPFKKLKEAIRELRDCNFDVNIYYSVNDEIGELAQEMNKMIHSFKAFDELRSDRIGVENRKFDALANMTNLLVLVANNEGKLIYMNNRLYSLLKVQSEEVIGKDIGSPSSIIPTQLSDACQLAIKRRSKWKTWKSSLTQGTRKKMKKLKITKIPFRVTPPSPPFAEKRVPWTTIL